MAGKDSKISVRVPGTQCLFCNSNGKQAHSEEITTIICSLILFTPHLYTHHWALCRKFPRMSRLERDASDSHSPWNEDLSNSLLGDNGKADKHREQLSNLGLDLTWALH